jgi:hypothetical protein
VIGVYNTAYGDGTAPRTGEIIDEVRARAVAELFPVFWQGGR